jgi:hypothetical protein
MATALDLLTQPGCARGADIDRHALFRTLYDRWMAAKPGRNGTALCAFLDDTRKQIVTGYRHNHPGRTPPWWVLVRMMADLGLELRVTDAGAVLTRRRGRGADGPGTRQGDEVIPFTTGDQG